MYFNKAGGDYGLATKQTVRMSHFKFYTIVIQLQMGDKLKEKPECLTSGSVMLWGAFCWNDLGPLILLAGRVTANQYKVVLSDRLYPVMKHFYPDESGLLQDDNAPIDRARGVTERFESRKMMWITCYGLRSHQISTQSNTYGRFDEGMREYLLEEWCSSLQ